MGCNSPLAQSTLWVRLGELSDKSSYPKSKPGEYKESLSVLEGLKPSWKIRVRGSSVTETIWKIKQRNMFQ